MRTPEFWYPAAGWPNAVWPWLLAPASLIYAAAGWLRGKLTHPSHVPIPVICVGNLTAGGTGKTPVAIALAARLAADGAKVHFLSRGYGGAASGPLLVDPRFHDAAEVGDEALLLAAAAPTWIARNRRSGAAAAHAAGAQILILDDGHQNPQLAKDLSLLLIDTERGLGNGWVIPSGPLREPKQWGLARADILLLIGGGSYAPGSTKPCLRAHRRLRDPERVRGKNIYAFCGIGAPQQFFDLLSNAGAILTGTESFPDHHRFTDQEISGILSRASQEESLAAATEKDWVRLTPESRQKITPIGMEMIFPDEQELRRLLGTIASLRR